MRKQLLTAAFASMFAIATAAGAQVYVRVGPPPPRHEVMPPPPMSIRVGCGIRDITAGMAMRMSGFLETT